jgi:hypothetical protein
VQVGDTQDDGRHDRKLARDHGVEARRVEIEEPFVGHDLNQERKAVDEQAPADPAVPERQRPDQADCGSVSERIGRHFRA